MREGEKQTENSKATGQNRSQQMPGCRSRLVRGFVGIRSHAIIILIGVTVCEYRKLSLATFLACVALCPHLCRYVSPYTVNAFSVLTMWIAGSPC